MFASRRNPGPATSTSPDCNARIAIVTTALLLFGLWWAGAVRAETFDFDSAPIHTSLPLDQTSGAITAHFTATGQGFSIQRADAMGFTPTGFGGLCIYPNSVFPADLQISFSVPLTGFSILYAPQELGCDDSAIMRLTTYLDGVMVGTTTTTAPAPGTWPTGTLSTTEPTGFNQVVIHYDHRPLCTDYGPIFMADNMNVTAITTSVPFGHRADPIGRVEPNPFRASTRIRVTLDQGGPLTVMVHDIAGRRVRSLARQAMYGSGEVNLIWDGRNDAGYAVGSGLYLCRITSGAGDQTTRVILRR